MQETHEINARDNSDAAWVDYIRRLSSSSSVNLRLLRRTRHVGLDKKDLLMEVEISCHFGLKSSHLAAALASDKR